MANPTGYGDLIPQSYSAANTEGIIPTKWADEIMQFVPPNLFWAQYLEMAIDWEAKAGQVVRVPLFGDMIDTSWPALTAGTTITVGSIAHTYKNVQVNEAGRGIGMETLLNYFSKYDHETAIKRALARNFGQAWDNACQAIFTSCLFYHRSVAAGSLGGIQYSGAGTGTGAVTGTLMSDLVEQVVDDMRTVRVHSTYGSFVIQPFDDGLYRWVANANTLRAIKKEADWRTFQTRDKEGEGLQYWELGEWEGFLFVENPKLSNGTSLVFGRGVGAQGFAGNLEAPNVPYSQGQEFPMQVRYEGDYQQDFGRGQAYAWYCVAGSAVAYRDEGTFCRKVFTT